MNQLFSSSPGCGGLRDGAEVHALLLDHNQDDCAKLTEQLTQGGYSTATVTSVKQAREALMRQVFDLVILELQLPDGHGFQFCSEIRDCFGDDMVIIFVTNDAATRHRVTGIQLGADDFLDKPCDTEELLYRITVRTKRRKPAEE